MNGSGIDLSAAQMQAKAQAQAEQMMQAQAEIGIRSLHVQLTATLLAPLLAQEYHRTKMDRDEERSQAEARGDDFDEASNWNVLGGPATNIAMGLANELLIAVGLRPQPKSPVLGPR